MAALVEEEQANLTVEGLLIENQSLREENQLLKKRINSLSSELKTEKEKNEHLSARWEETKNNIEWVLREIKKLRAENNYLKKLLYGDKSEKTKEIKENRGDFSTPGEENTERKPGAQEGHEGHGRKIPQNLPVVEEFHELPEKERYCQRCGLPLEELPDTEDSYEICVRKTYFLRRHRRKKYRKTCCCPNPIILNSLK